MTGRLIGVVLIGSLAIIGLSNLSFAGTEAAPEIADPAGDAKADFTDITKVWFTASDPTKFEVHMALAAIPPSPGVSPAGAAGVELAYYVDILPVDPDGAVLTPKTATYQKSYVAATFTKAAPPSADALWGFADGHVEQGTTGDTYTPDNDIMGSVEGNVLTWVVPREGAPMKIPVGDAAAGYKLTGLSAFSNIVPRVVLGLLIDDDHAPDMGVGANFVFPAPAAPAPGATGPVYAALEGDQAQVVKSFPDATTGSFVYNWTTATTAGTVTYAANLSAGSVAFDVLDGDGKSVASGSVDANGSKELDYQAAKVGTWQVKLDFTGYTGEFSINVVPAASGSTDEPGSTAPATSSAGSSEGTPGSSSPAGGSAGNSGNVTNSSAAGSQVATKKGIPGPGLVLVAAGVLAVVALRRRKA